jgi:LmbE family N-acetylglucosaminyl deacetylase
MSQRLVRLVLAPHADDESLGCGGLLAKYPDTVVVVCAAPSPEREAEFDRAMNALAVHRVAQLELEDGKVGQDPRLLTSLVDRVLAVYKPDELYIPAPGTHQDHIAVYQAGLRSARLSMQSGHWMPKTVLVYDVPTYGLDLAPTGLQWTVYEQLDPVHVRRKADAVACYESQIPSDNHPAAMAHVHRAAQGAGVEVGVLFAEKYAPVRMVRP